MVRKTALVTAMLGAFASQAFAMGLGEIQLHSALNQPLLAEIELLKPTASDLNDLNVALASSAAYAKAGVERTFFHTRLRFSLDKRADGKAVIRVTSHDPVREPYLNFMLDVTWGSGQALREYTVLVDPPVLMPALAPTVESPQVQAAPPMPTRSTAAPVTESRSTSTSSRLAEGQYEVGRNETTWRVATAVRPDSSVSMEQVMISLLRANPHAFFDNNINNLKAGEILRVPSVDEMAAISTAQARAAVQEQSNQWRGGSSAAATSVQAEAAPASETPAAATSPETVAATEAEPQLKLVAPKTDGTDAKAAAGEQSAEAVREELALATEAVEAQRQQNAELASRLKELEEQNQKLHGLLELKNAELAQLSGSAVPATTDVTAAAPADAVAPADEVAAAATDEAQTTPDATATADADTAAPVEEAVTAEAKTAEPVLDEAKPEASVPQPKVVAAAPEAPSSAAGEPTDVITSLLENPLIKWGVAGAAILAGLLAWMSGRRRSMASAEFQESILADKKTSAKNTAGLAAAAAASAVAVSAEVKKEIDAVAAKTATPEESGQTDSSMFTDFAVSDLGALQNDVEADPVAEADVYLAYGRYQQAEELIRGALNNHAQDNNLRFKLLEVLSAAKNINAFDTEAEALLANLGSPEDALWLKAMAMGKELNPANPLYSGVGAATMQAEAEHDLGLEYDLGGTGISNEMDFSESAETFVTETAKADDNSLDFDLGELDAFTAKLDESTPIMPVEEDFNYDLGAGDDDEFAGEGQLTSSDEVATKLDLARAYVEMGDPDGARSILQEVLEEGNDAQKSEAQTLLSAIA